MRKFTTGGAQQRRFCLSTLVHDPHNLEPDLADLRRFVPRFLDFLHSKVEIGKYAGYFFRVRGVEILGLKHKYQVIVDHAGMNASRVHSSLRVLNRESDLSHHVFLLAGHYTSA
jgi:hypothetical protein